METKVCKFCKEEKFIGDFYIDNKSDDGFKNLCKICWKETKELREQEIQNEKILRKKKQEEDKLFAQKLKEEEKELRKKIREEEKCKKIKEEKLKKQIENEKVQLEIIQRINHEKMLSESKIKSKIKLKELSILKIKFKEQNKKELEEFKKKYDEKLKPILKESKKYLLKKRKKEDPVYKLSCDIRSLIHSTFKNNGYKKNSRSEEIIGCSFEELKLYFENLFEDWMTWKNHGVYTGKQKTTWQIDHIIPISSARTIEDVIKLNHYTNLQPLCSYINQVLKRDKLNYYGENY